ncbi:adenine-specific DNA-methyltransferase [Amaricoccus macauensis]|uniref:site-specific DNA-methyltransferase (adenine-specific) n=1 Tax=Amaricoccus macauensis TaxID=57001 RepID=A0A840SJ86_9RHOB|nr:site-specific DNA-methyltransferase [Amaricoccus macauensis]MBB5221014.1 adenine-specific DNA-methyltransferase [Amaricoccus macauensis]
MAAKTKLELTWIGKDIRPRLEPRILIEEPELSYHAKARREGDIFDNLLIHGDNLLALKALETDPTVRGKVKCVYIDPPFNTQQALPNYDDGLEHSLWLSLMRERLEILSNLLSDDGSIYIHIDDNELAYLTVMADQIFGRVNRISIVTFKQGSATGHKSINPGVVSTSNFVLIYAKNKSAWKPNRIFVERSGGRDARYSKFIVNRNAGHMTWRFTTLMKAFSEWLGLPERGLKKELGDEFEQKITDFVHQHADAVIQPARPDYNSVSSAAREMIDVSRADPSTVYKLERGEGLSDMYFLGGQRLLFYRDKLKLVDGEWVSGEPLTSIWDDILSNNLHNEGGVEFPKGKKPEALIKRCIELSSNIGDLVLDSFGGSGTTGAVAHKMGRRWIMVELGDHAKTHIVPRLRSVIDGTDRGGVTDAMSWKGGGGYRFARLAPSLMEKDAWGNWVIRTEYNPAMLAEAMCKHFNYTYAPSTEHFWMHGHSSETSYIYVTTNSLTGEQLRALSDEVGEHRSLLICCKAFEEQGARAFTNLTIRKIPGAVLDRCEWGKDDYSLKIESLPMMQEEDEEDVALAPKRGGKADTATGDLFADKTEG